MRRASYSEVEMKIWNQQLFTSGDCAFTDTVWERMRVLPTDPGTHMFIHSISLDSSTAPHCIQPSSEFCEHVLAPRSFRQGDEAVLACCGLQCGLASLMRRVLPGDS